MSLVSWKSSSLSSSSFPAVRSLIVDDIAEFQIKKSVVVLAILSFMGSCYAQGGTDQQTEGKLPKVVVFDKNESEYYMGLTGGVNAPINSALASSTEMGFSFGYQPSGNVGLGAEVTTSELKDFEKHQRTTALIQSAFKIGGDIPVLRGSYLGVGAGPTFVANKTEWTVAPVVGFDIPLGSQARDVVSFGLNAKYIGVTNSPDSYVGNAVVKYWY